jgi:type I restriction enzyme S subunit
MNKVEELIQQLCPEGVEYKELREVCKQIFAGGTPSSNEGSYYGGEIPWLRSGEINFNEISRTEIKITEKGLNNSSAKWVPANSVFIAMTGATVARTAVNVIPLTANQSCCCMIPKNEILNYKFLYYVLANRYIELKNMGQGVLTSLNTARIKAFIVPIPPLLIQQEIVSILDKFTQLEARKKQYEYYRNELLTFGDDVEWKTLGEVGEFIRGKRFVKNDIVSTGVPCFHYGELYTHYKIWTKEAKSFLEPAIAAKLRVAHPGDVVIVTAGETIEDIGNAVAWLGESDIVIHDACFAYHHSMNPKYVSYYMRTNLFRSQIKRHISSGKISSVNAPGLKQAKIPIPPLAEQERIVNILDKFDALVNDISIGLPAEIEARRKQYEYYRGKLLTFKKYE